MPPFGVATVPPSPSTTQRARWIGATIAAASAPRTQCGTITFSVWTSRPSAVIACAAHAIAWSSCGRAREAVADVIGELGELLVRAAIGARGGDDLRRDVAIRDRRAASRGARRARATSGGAASGAASTIGVTAAIGGAGRLFDPQARSRTATTARFMRAS